MNKFPIHVILADLRSNVNVGSILRTADACGVERVCAAGYTPYPLQANQADERPPHIAYANTKAIARTALGAEQTIPVHHSESTMNAVREAKRNGFQIIMIEQAKNSLNMLDYLPTGPCAVVFGSEVEGIHPDTLKEADVILEIPMIGQKESYGVAVAAGIALHWLRFGR